MGVPEQVTAAIFGVFWPDTPVFETEMKSPWGEVSPRVERVTAYKSFLKRGNFTPGDFTAGRNLNSNKTFLKKGKKG